MKNIAVLFCFFALSSFTNAKHSKILNIGDDAPHFQLKDQDGFIHSILQNRGKWVLLFFYPRDFTLHVTKEVLAFEKFYSKLKSNNIVVYGISNDFEHTHSKFHNMCRLTYDLLSDENEYVINSYKAKKLLGVKFISYLIGPDGRIFRKYENIKPSNIPILALQDIE